MLTDLRLAIRSALRHPAFSIVVVTTLALGIGANTAMFSIITCRPSKATAMQGRGTDRVASTTFGGQPNPGSSAPVYFDYQEQTVDLEALSAMSWGSSKLTVTGGEQSEVVSGCQVRRTAAWALRGIAAKRQPRHINDN